MSLLLGLDEKIVAFVIRSVLLPVVIVELVFKECDQCQRKVFLCDKICKYCDNKI